MRTIVIAVSLCATALGHCFAQTSPAVMHRIETRITPQPLGSALKEFAESHHVQVLFLTADVSGLRTLGASGNLTADETVASLLRGTGLNYRYVDANAVSIIPACCSKGATREPSNSVKPVLRSDTIHNKETDPAPRSADPPVPSTHRNGNMTRTDQQALNEVVITGSRLQSTSNEGPQEVQVYDRVKIDQSGQDSLSGFLTTLPSVPVTSLSTAHGVAPTVALRGLPVGTTLVLLNGRRVESSGLTRYFGAGDYFDLNNIPLSAVERMEVEEDGSSAIYGSDAIAGVVNIILKNNFEGISANAKYTWGRDLRRVRTGVALGKQWRRGGLSVFASYGRDGGLLNSQRFLSANNDYRNFAGGDHNYPACNPGNVFSRSGAPLAGAPAGSMGTYAAITGTTTSGKPSFSQFSYGALNECSLIADSSILPSTDHAGVLVEGHVIVSLALEFFTEVLYTRVNQTQATGYPVLFGIPSVQVYTVAASNPFNPFGTIVGVAESLHQLPITQNVSTDFFRPLIGLKGTLVSRWQWEVAAWQSSDWTRDYVRNLVANHAAIQAALNSTNPESALNPFVTGPVASASILRALVNDGDIKWMGRDRSAEAFVRGPLLRLPAGDIQGVIGGDYVQSTLYFNEINDGVDPPNTKYNFRRRYDAVFAEARVPLIAGRAYARSVSRLAITLAGRHDHYSDFGGATTAQFGLEYRPLSTVLLRASYGDAFKAPSLPDLHLPETAGPALVKDPNTGASTLVRLISGGNPSLRALTGRSHSIGVHYSSIVMHGLQLSATQWRVVENHAIQSVPAQVIVNNAAVFPGRVIRNAAEGISQVVDTELNFGSIDVAGIDYQLEYGRLFGNGRWSFGIEATQTYHYKQALVAGQTPLEATSKSQDDGLWAPRWKGIVSLGWTNGSLVTHVDARYTGAYSDYDSARQIGNFWMADANLRWNFRWRRNSETGWSDQAYLDAGATNVFNRGPQFSNFGSGLYGYDVAEMSILGRALYIDFGIQW